MIDAIYSDSSFSFPFLSLVNATEGPLAYFVTTDHDRACAGNGAGDAHAKDRALAIVDDSAGWRLRRRGVRG